MKAIVILWQTGVFAPSPVGSGGLHLYQMRTRRVSTFVEQDERWIQWDGAHAQRGTGRRPPVCVDRYPMGFGRRPRGRVQAPAQRRPLAMALGPWTQDSDVLFDKSGIQSCMVECDELTRGVAWSWTCSSGDDVGQRGEMIFAFGMCKIMRATG